MIRKFKDSDLARLIEIGREMHSESSYAHLSFSEEKCRNLFFACLNLPEDFLGIVCEQHGEIIGMFVGNITPYFFGSQKIASDLLLYIAPEFRGGAAAVRLVKEYEKWANLLGAAQVMLGVTTGIDEVRTIEFYKRLGYKAAGAIFKK